ncbi:MAG: hydrogenase, partial [Acidithiobacillaceae bacterium]|nr:hydrogenase [Acidithiobacillaceae bacterium]
MLNSFLLAAGFFVLAIVLGLLRLAQSARIALIIGTLATLSGSVLSLSSGNSSGQLWSLGDIPVTWHLQAAAAWLIFWGGLAALAAFLSPSRAKNPGIWMSGAGLALLGCLGIAGLQEGIAFLIAWE